MNRSVVTWLGIAAVALAAAVLSFASLRSLAIVCGTPSTLAWLPASVHRLGRAGGHGGVARR